VYTRILVPLDGSAVAEEALAHAVQMADRFGSELIFLRAVFLPQVAAFDLAEVQQALVRESQAYLNEMARPLRAPGRRIHTVVRWSEAAEAIIEYAVTQQVAVVVMATHGHRGLESWPMGSVAEKVLRSMQVRLLLVRSSQRPDSALEPAWRTAPSVSSADRLYRTTCPLSETAGVMYNTILVPLDGSDLAASILAQVEHLAHGYGARLILLTVGPSLPVSWPGAQDIQRTLTFEAEAALERLRTTLALTGLEVEMMVCIGDPASEILEAAERYEVDLIILNSRGGQGAPSPFLGSVAAKVAGASAIPVLVLNTSAEKIAPL
jgi:nucleotide-binding universal stress UspA family protein